ncbi:DEKNAAC101006 [Brettanomyces naardenensis]|uniref:DEKNAAC101006 n=1 Tax=Brettanomyces naardenensis TaxID=13370 RepID=A0A448YGV0_BRENA|nr:DEKNAAC101006 [Brettanomyces naardenensis]
MSSYKLMLKELSQFSAAAFRRRSKDVATKEEALIKYKRMQFKRAGKKLSADEDRQLVESVREKFGLEAPKPDVSLLSFLSKEGLSETEKRHLSDITLFLRSQRVYEELLERYNPGISMAQKDKVEKTARKVGLEVPN